MRVVHIVSQDNGGAGRACVRLHNALLKSGIDSIVLTQNKTTDLPSIHRVAQTRFQKLIAKIRPHLSQLPLLLYSKRVKDIFSPHLPFFTLRNRTLTQTIKNLKPDIIHLHWVEGGFFHLKDLHSIQAPILWSLHDANPYTGGCHIVASTCIRVGRHCKSCPLLNSKFPFDISFWTFRQKAKTYKKLYNLTINGLSRWIAQSAKDSALLKEKPIINLPNPIDTDIYTPIEKSLARVLLHITQPKKFLSFGALNATSTPRKGFQELESALDSLPDSLKAQCEVLVFGSSGSEKKHDIGGIRTHYLGTLQDDISLSLVYSASDIFIMPSHLESFGQTALEALSCGTPVVSFDTSGLKDIVIHKYNGYLATCYDIQDLARGIQWILESNDYQALARNARQNALENFNAPKVAQSYIQTYRQLTGGGAVDNLCLIAKHILPAFLPDIISSKFFIGFAALEGSSVHRKGFHELQLALNSLPDSLKTKCELIVFGGNAPNTPGIKTHILGRLNDENSLALAYNACDIFVVPSLAENLSNVIMESLSCGTPVVSFDIGGNSDLIKHKENGYLAQNRNDLSAGIEWIFNLAPDTYQNLSIRARESVCENFKSEKIAQAYIEAYAYLLGGGEVKP